MELDTDTKTILTFTGVNLDQYDSNTCEVEVLGILASCEITSGSSIEATFEFGYPVTESEAIPTLRLLDDCDDALETLCSDAEV